MEVMSRSVATVWPFCAEIQHRLEDCAVQDDVKAKESAAAGTANTALTGGKRRKPERNK
jgi:hypothetical protein